MTHTWFFGSHFLQQLNNALQKRLASDVPRQQMGMLTQQSIGLHAVYNIGQLAPVHDGACAVRVPSMVAVSYTHLTLPTNREV